MKEGDYSSEKLLSLGKLWGKNEKRVIEKGDAIENDSTCVVALNSCLKSQESGERREGLAGSIRCNPGPRGHRRAGRVRVSIGSGPEARIA